MKILKHPSLMALGLTMVCLAVLVDPLASSNHLTIYHLDGSAYSIFGPVFILICIVWLFFTLVFWMTKKSGLLQTIVFVSAGFLLPWTVLKYWFIQSGSPPRWLNLAAFISPLIIAAIVVMERRSSGRTFSKIQSVTPIILGCLGVGGSVVLIQLLWCGWGVRSLNSVSSYSKPIPSQARKPHRIVWLILDELSYQQVYESRFPGLQLPNFDRLAAQSVVFSHVIPAGPRTEIVIPSLMTGHEVDQIRSSADGRRVAMHDPSTEKWVRFDEHDTIFQDTADMGYSTGVSGWFNPYCRILPTILNSCFWANELGFHGAMVPNHPIWWNTKQFFVHQFRTFSSLIKAPNMPSLLWQDAQSHQRDYWSLSAAADRLLDDPSIDFVFLHMPIPHPVGIYDRKTQALEIGHHSYIDNLALADLYLGHLRSELDKTGGWNSATVVVMGDHSWRTYMWYGQYPWTPEDNLASHNGKFDDRPGYIVKLPNQTRGYAIDKPFAAVRTRALLDALIRDKLQTPEELASWATQNN
jgi:Sulfatase